MNTKNNKRYKSSSKKIEDAFLNLVAIKNYDDINISEICQVANINRSTFYAHYDDINHLIIKIEQKFANMMASIFNDGLKMDNQAFINMFEFIKTNKEFYKAFLRIPYITLAEKNVKQKILENVKSTSIIHKNTNDIEIYYRANFFGAGIKAICEIWLERDCKETPEQMAHLLIKEYRNSQF